MWPGRVACGWATRGGSGGCTEEERGEAEASGHHGAAGRDFHNFNVVYRDDPQVRVVAFTATQIPRIDRRRYPPELAGQYYPDGIPIVPESTLDSVIKGEAVDEVVFAYSDVSHELVMHQASRVLAAGADFTLLGLDSTAVPCSVPVISVLATRTGAGKSPTSRFVAGCSWSEASSRRSSATPCPTVIWSPNGCSGSPPWRTWTVRKRRWRSGKTTSPISARVWWCGRGWTYQAIVAQAQEEASIIIWDGGNNDFSFLRSDLIIVVVDPFRPGHELAYHPGEMNLRCADIAVISKVNTAPPENVERVIKNIREVNSHAVVVLTDTRITTADSGRIKANECLSWKTAPP